MVLTCDVEVFAESISAGHQSAAVLLTGRAEVSVEGAGALSSPRTALLSGGLVVSTDAPKLIGGVRPARALRLRVELRSWSRRCSRAGNHPTPDDPFPFATEVIPVMRPARTAAKSASNSSTQQLTLVDSPAV